MTEDNKLKLPLNLQFFAEGGDGADQDDNNPGGDDDKQQDDKQQDENKQNNKQQGNEKTFTQEDVSNIASKESKAAVEKLLKDLGFDDFENAKDGVDKFKEHQESQKTEAEKQEGKVKTLSKQLELSQTENENLKAQMGAYKAGVDPEAVDDVVALAKVQVDDDTDIDTAIAKVVEKYPHFKAGAADEKDDIPKKKTVVGGNPQGSSDKKEEESWKEFL